MTEDGILLRKYAETGLEEAFSELVQRHLPLVYSAALRQLRGDETLAKDVAQSVFIDLARKAKSLSNHELLVGWMYSATRLAASRALRGERRRQRREQIAAEMHRTNNEGEPRQSNLEAVLDAAMNKLAIADRNVLLLRFFQAKTFKEVGLEMKLSEDAARMRVTRALEKLQKLIGKRGVTVPKGVLGTILATQTIQTTPAGLAGIISAVAVNSIGVNAGFVGIVKLLTSAAKAKAAIVSAVLVAGGLTVMIVQQKEEANQTVRQAQLPPQQIDPAFQDSDGSVPAIVQPNSVGRTDDQSVYIKRQKRLAALGEEGRKLKARAAIQFDSRVAKHGLALSKVALLKAWLEALPERNIPEIQQCTDGDWLDVVRWAQLEDETGARKALQGLRDNGKRRFNQKIIAAVKRYADEHEGKPPVELAKLNEYLEPEMAQSFSERYQFVTDPSGGSITTTNWVITERKLADSEYDTIHEIGFHGFTLRLSGAGKTN
jgi:RNA polymerase sigma factor (sigma-70 family)